MVLRIYAASPPTSGSAKHERGFERQRSGFASGKKGIPGVRVQAIGRAWDGDDLNGLEVERSNAQRQAAKCRTVASRSSRKWARFVSFSAPLARSVSRGPEYQGSKKGEKCHHSYAESSTRPPAGDRAPTGNRGCDDQRRYHASRADTERPG